MRCLEIDNVDVDAPAARLLSADAQPRLQHLRFGVNCVLTPDAIRALSLLSHELCELDVLCIGSIVNRDEEDALAELVASVRERCCLKVRLDTTSVWKDTRRPNAEQLRDGLLQALGGEQAGPTRGVTVLTRWLL